MCFKHLLVQVLMLQMCNTIIEINIKTASNKKDLSVKYSGYDAKVITEKEIALFNITEDNLKRGIRKELGKIPNDVFIKDPTPYGNLYHEYHWQEVKREVSISNYKVIDIITEDIALKVHDYINNATENMKAKIDLFEVVEATISSSWEQQDYSFTDDDFFYNVNVDFKYKVFQNENKWKMDTLKSVLMYFGISTQGYIEVESGQTVTTKLSASKTTILIEIEYVIRLIGNVIANYAHVYGKYHFWAPSIGNIMKAADIEKSIRTKEILEIKCYTNPLLDMFDKSTGAPVRFINPNMSVAIRRIAKNKSQKIRTLSTF